MSQPNVYCFEHIINLRRLKLYSHLRSRFASIYFSEGMLSKGFLIVIPPFASPSFQASTRTFFAVGNSMTSHTGTLPFPPFLTVLE
jgi:hypothetical protein